MGRKRTISRVEQRAPYQEDEEYDEDEDREDDDNDDDDDDDISSEDDEDEEEEEKPKKKAPVKRTRKPRASKNPRMKVVWAVYDNSNKSVATFDYNQKEEAEAHAQKLETEKNKGAYFVQPVKVPIEETLS